MITDIARSTKSKDAHIEVFGEVVVVTEGALGNLMKEKNQGKPAYFLYARIAETGVGRSPRAREVRPVGL